ncbi:hypothetical protein ABT263_08380 [Kitasatospora sp. NPDC001603]|uniref:hypothetical protein n=1 Tax=Kitasatospora sp. NPDC001603 TaxID=3154388 RepID=UPI00332EF79E
MRSGPGVWAALVGGAACVLLVLAAGAATDAALRYGNAGQGQVILAGATYISGLGLLLAALLLGPRGGRGGTR